MENTRDREGDTSAGKKIVLGSAHIDLREEMRPDGYRPLAAGLARGLALRGSPKHQNWRYVITAARCLDGAHRQFERLREGLDNYRHPDVAAAFNLATDAELAVMGLHRALEMTKEVRTRLGIARSLPVRLSRRAEGIKELRDAFAHIEERAAGYRYKRSDPALIRSLYRGAAALLESRTIRFGRRSLGVGKPATDLMMEVREYLRATWHDL